MAILMKAKITTFLVWTFVRSKMSWDVGFSDMLCML